jgi:hypothetical protein
VSGEQGRGPDGSSGRLRVAEVFDGRGPTGGIVVDRPPVDPGELPALTAYLTKAPVALATTKTGEDEMSPGAGLMVPRAYHTDGEWIWPAAVGYYLHRYRLPPQPELLAHIRSRGFYLGPVSEELRQAAAAQMLEELAAKRAAPQPAPPAPTPAPAPAPTSAPEPAAAGGSLFAPTPQIADVRQAEPTLWLPSPVQGEAIAPPTPSSETPSSAAPASAAPVSAAPPTTAPALEPEPAAGADSRPQTPALVDGALPVTLFSAALTAAGNRHAAWVYEQIETFLDYMPLDEWSVDHASRRYRQGGREFVVDALGRLALDGRWIWAWAEPGAWSPDPALTERSRLLRDAGDRLGIRELTAPALDLSLTEDADDPEIAAEMLTWTAMGVSGARGYIGHSSTDDGRVYYLAFDETIPVAKPDIDGVPHFLSHGIAKFEEDATDCVLGYVEHYGWDWSRSPEGIVVSAGELGSFTADLSPDGVLTGISLHR